MLGVRLDPETERRLQEIARRSRRSKSDLAREAIERFVRRHDAALLTEAALQSRHAVERGWAEEDAFWEAIAAVDDFDAAPSTTKG